MIVPSTLNDILSKDRELLNLVQESLQHISELFGEDAKFELEPFVDPESTRVFLVVRTTLDVEEGHNRMEKLDEWWLDQSHRGSGLLSIALDYI